YAISQGTYTYGSNYDETYVGADFEITQRAITITADAGQSKTYGDADPTLTATVTSGTIVGGDVATGSLVRAAGENVGLYAISQGTYTYGSNYDLSFLEGNLEITVREIEVTADDQAKVYGEADPALTYQITSGSLAFSDAFTGALGRDAGEDVGNYAITQGTLALSSNYDL
ncbi:MBG domain-containing protein, partial [Algoriphagus aestuariicola]